MIVVGGFALYARAASAERGRMTVLDARPQRPDWQVTLGAALLGLGFLIAAQLASEGPRVRYTTQERTPLLETATGLQAQQDELKERLLDLRDADRGDRGSGPGLGSPRQ